MMKAGSVLSIIFIPLVRLTNHHEYLTPHALIQNPSSHNSFIKCRSRRSFTPLPHASKIRLSVPLGIVSIHETSPHTDYCVLLLTYFSSKAVECELSFLLPPSLVVGSKMDALPKRRETSNRIRPLPMFEREKLFNMILLPSNFVKSRLKNAGFLLKKGKICNFNQKYFKNFSSLTRMMTFILL